jgi:hypothetical protein
MSHIIKSQIHLLKRNAFLCRAITGNPNLVGPLPDELANLPLNIL